MLGTPQPYWKLVNQRKVVVIVRLGEGQNKTNKNPFWNLGT